MVVYEQKLGIGQGIFISDQHTLVYLSVKSEEASLTNCKQLNFMHGKTKWLQPAAGSIFHWWEIYRKAKD